MGGCVGCDQSAHRDQRCRAALLPDHGAIARWEWSRPPCIAPREQAVARRRANRRTAVRIGECHALRCEHRFPPVAATDLIQRRKGDAKKVRIALRLRRERTMTLAWIAQRLQTGTKTHLANLLYRQKRQEYNAPPYQYSEPTRS